MNVSKSTPLLSIIKPTQILLYSKGLEKRGLKGSQRGFTECGNLFAFSRHDNITMNDNIFSITI